MSEPALSTSLYWQSLPSPCEFKFSLGRAMEEVRHLEIHTNHNPVTGMGKAIEDGIRSGFTQHQRVVLLNIGKGQEIASEIGAHCHRTAGITPSLLAMDELGLAAVVLRPFGGTAALACRAYLEEFKRACEQPGGTAKLVVVFESENPPQEALEQPKHRVIVFDGMLSPEEIQAYVAVKMIGRSGPNGSNLLRALVQEFAGYDPMLAESLMALDDAQILSLPNSLDLIYQPDHLRWREDSWGRGAIRYHLGEVKHHTLRQYFLSKHEVWQKKQMAKELASARWRACVNALLPWLEIQRGYIVEIFKKKLQIYAENNGGKIVVGKERQRTVEIDDMEYGDITYYAKSKIQIDTSLEKAALDFAWAAKAVRDEIAHLRAPNTNHVADVMKGYVELERRIRS